MDETLSSLSWGLLGLCSDYNDLTAFKTHVHDGFNV